MISFPISSPIYPWHPPFPSPHTPSRPAYYAIFSARVHLHTIGYSYRFSTLIAYVVNPSLHPLVPSASQCYYRWNNRQRRKDRHTRASRTGSLRGSSRRTRFTLQAWHLAERFELVESNWSALIIVCILIYCSWSR